MTTTTPEHPLRHYKAAVALDAGACAVEPPRFVMIDPERWVGFTLRQIAAGVYTLATDDVS